MIEEDAYQLLHLYLSRLEKNLSGQQGSKDIIEDIELRIAELCQQLLFKKIESMARTLPYSFQPLESMLISAFV